MEILLADHAGFCFGVKRAMDMTQETIQSADKQTYSLGPLVHNSQVVEYLKEKGLKVLDDFNEIKDLKEKKIIIRSHGIPMENLMKLKEKGLDVLDCTCPFVKSVHDKVKEFYQNDYNIVIIGDPKHPEVIGINGWCNNKAYIVNDIFDAENLPELDKVCVVSQTTNTFEKFETLSNIVKAREKEVIVFNTICSATNLRQKSCAEIAQKVDAMIVIGGYNSSNTNKLVEISKKYCHNVYHVEKYDELPLDEIKKYKKVGITAGASTPAWIIKEVKDKMDNLDNEEMMKAIENSVKRIFRGDIIDGQVISVTDDEVMVNIGYKSDGIVNRNELSNDPQVNPKDIYKEGDKIEVYVVSLDDGEGNLVLSTKRVESIKGWDDLEEIFKNGEDVNCKVTEVVKGGTIAIVKGLRGFIPASQISAKYVSDLNQFVGKNLLVKVIDFDREKKRIILSRKEIEKAELEKKVNEVWNTLEKGKLVEGEVKRLTNFGAFVDIGGIDGLIHISELSWRKIKHPSEIVKEGQKVKVYILDFDKDKNKISLSLKDTMPDPWETLLNNYKVGDIVEGNIVNLLDFGAFVRLNIGVDGLVHISQISNEHINRPSDVLKIGDSVKVKIIDINEKEKKLGLSIKDANEKNNLDEEKLNYNNEDINVTIEDMIQDK